MCKMLDLLILDSAMRNAVLMKDDITNDPEESGIIAETAVYKHIKAFIIMIVQLSVIQEEIKRIKKLILL